MSSIILYDLPSKDQCACWSMNPWRSAKPKALSRSSKAESNRVCAARLLLNYKRLPYTTTWLEYPEIAPHLKSLGIAPNETDTPYTIPTISLTLTHHIMDSVAIAAYLESTFPVPPIHPDAPEVATVEKAVGAAFSPIAPIIVSGIPRNLLNESSKKHFEKGFEDGVGMSTEEFGRSVTREACLEKAREPWVELASLLKKNGGPFVRGMEVSYADFHVIAWMQCCRRVDEEVFASIVSTDEAFGRLYQACEKWLARDD